jgi:hypothetical protein
MDKATRNYWLDILMGLLALVLGGSSFLLWVIFPHGYYPSRLLWLTLHKWVGLALGVSVLVHLAFQWKLLVRMTRRRVNRLVSRRDDPRRAGAELPSYHLESSDG